MSVISRLKNRKHIQPVLGQFRLNDEISRTKYGSEWEREKDCIDLLNRFATRQGVLYVRGS